MATRSKSTTDPDANILWMTRWLDAVAAGQSPMSQRNAASIDAHGGLALVKRLARARGVHLLQLTDDQGRVLLAASRTPFKVIC